MLNDAFLYRLPVTVPSACAQFPYEISRHSENILRNKYANLVRFTDMPQGGHFAAMEEPKLLADDIWTSIEKMEALKKKNMQENNKNKNTDL